MMNRLTWINTLTPERTHATCTHWEGDFVAPCRSPPICKLYQKRWDAEKNFEMMIAKQASFPSPPTCGISDFVKA